jgi:hypothetical protein
MLQIQLNGGDNCNIFPLKFQRFYASDNNSRIEIKLLWYVYRSTSSVLEIRPQWRRGYTKEFTQCEHSHLSQLLT